jgi:hypothetical protein
MHSGTVLSEATDHPANKTQTGRSDDGYRHSISSLIKPYTTLWSGHHSSTR